MTSETPDNRTWVHEIRTRLESPVPRELEPETPGRPASVLVPLYVEAGELWVVLTKRSEALANHAGQYAFPGGRREEVENDWEAAIRETEEEIGIDANRILDLGRLDEIYTDVSDFRIVPCVGAVPVPLETTLNEAEIEEVFSVPLLAFADVKVIEDRVVEWRGEERQVRVYHIGRRAVWGLTARIIQNLLQRLGVDTAVEDAPPAPPA